MDNEKKITADMLNEWIKKENPKDYEVVKSGSLTLNVRKYLTIGETLLFVDNVVKSCFSSDGEYMPEIRGFAMDCTTLALYAGIELPADISERYDLIARLSDLITLVTDVVDIKQYCDIEDAITKRINAINAANTNQVMAKLNDVIESFDKVTEAMQSLFGGIDIGDVKHVMEAVGDGKINEEKLMKAYLDAKNNDEGHKDAE